MRSKGFDPVSTIADINARSITLAGALMSGRTSPQDLMNVAVLLSSLSEYVWSMEVRDNKIEGR